MIISIKLKSGADLIGEGTEISEKDQFITDPIFIESHMEFGTSMRVYASYVKVKTVSIPRSEIMFVGEASDLATSRYHEVLSSISDDNEEEPVHTGYLN